MWVLVFCPPFTSRVWPCWAPVKRLKKLGSSTYRVRRLSLAGTIEHYLGAERTITRRQISDVVQLLCWRYKSLFLALG